MPLLLLMIVTGALHHSPKLVFKTWWLLAVCMTLILSALISLGIMAFALFVWIDALAMTNVPLFTATEIHLFLYLKQIHNFTNAASVWNAEVFGSVGRNKKILMARLCGVQRCLDQMRSSNMVKLESKFIQELEVLLEQEELLWKQKSRIDWVNFNDRNTSYFHSKARAHTRKKMVQSLKLSGSYWCNNHDLLRDAATAFFAALFDTETALFHSSLFVVPSLPLPHIIMTFLLVCLMNSKLRGPSLKWHR
ncbi:hypothetical protein V6N13_071661 [Hibiscus sabdariffa]